MPPEGAKAQDAHRPAPTRSSCRATARRGCSRRPGVVDGPLPTHYEPAESAGRERALRRCSPTRRSSSIRRRRGTGTNPLAQRRLPVRRHHLPADRAPHGRRDEPHAALPGRAAAGVLRRGRARSSPSCAGWSNGEFATLVSARTAIEAQGAGHRADAADPAARRAGRAPDRRCPYHWAYAASRPATRPTTCWASCWTRTRTSRRPRSAPATSGPGRRPRGPELLEFVEDYRRRAGMESGRVPGQRPRPVEADDAARSRPADERRTRGGRHDLDQLGERGLHRPRPRRTGCSARCPTCRARPATTSEHPKRVGLLHRHLGVHRLQGLRGGLQGVEHAPDGRLARHAGRHRPVGDVLRQHRPAGRQLLAARGVHRAEPRRRPADAGVRPARATPGRTRGPSPAATRTGRQPGEGAAEQRAERRGAERVRPADRRRPARTSRSGG